MKPLTKEKAWSYAMLNVLATPGLGSLLARRFISGTGQLILAVAGFFLIMFWLIQKMRALYGQMYGTTLSADAGNSAGLWGLIIFLAAWIWTIITSVQMWRSATENPMSVPPVIR